MRYVKKEVSDEIDFLLADKHVSLLQIDTMTLTGIVKHFQSFQNSKVTMSLQCIKKKKLGREFIFSLQMNLKASYRLISTLWGIKDAYQGDTFITAGYDQAFSKY